MIYANDILNTDTTLSYLTITQKQVMVLEKQSISIEYEIHPYYNYTAYSIL